MLTAYLVVIGIGFAAFLLASFLDYLGQRRAKDTTNLRDHAFNDATAAVAKEEPASGIRQDVIASLAETNTDRLSNPTDTSPREELQDIKQALVDKLDHKCVKLEQILEEKNKILAQLQKDLEDERAHRGEFDSLQSVLQNQITELKTQNRSLRTELERSLEENLHLQTGITMTATGEQASSPNSNPPDSSDNIDTRLHTAASGVTDDIIPSHLDYAQQKQLIARPTEQESPDGSTHLKDIFSNKDKANQVSE